MTDQTKENEMSDSNRTATVTAPTTAIAGDGRGFTLQPGVYEFVDIDGAAERCEAYLMGPEGALVCVSATDSNVTISGKD
jgi:hypothetical protein